jgi:hypothetical protein
MGRLTAALEALRHQKLPWFESAVGAGFRGLERCQSFGHAGVNLED